MISIRFLQTVLDDVAERLLVVGFTAVAAVYDHDVFVAKRR